MIRTFFSPNPCSNLHQFLIELARDTADAKPQTELGAFMARHGSDKWGSWHNYTIVYERLFAPFRQAAFSLLEIGIGTNFDDVPSSMGTNGVPGASLRAWRDFFPHAQIVGADVDQRILFSEERIRTLFVDQTDPASIHAMWGSLGDEQFRVIIDDGLHTFEGNSTLLQNSLDHLAPGGYYIIEDLVLQPENQARYEQLIVDLGLLGGIIQLKHPSNVYDNCLLIAEKHGNMGSRSV
ncbi:MAG: hypothetical protein WBO09_15405 [Methylocystis silviterrae]|uniref:hypothetical protein n=1 Tax=Methylocystis silviterrae TaxID=2743612 RepID=UPI003C70C5AB